MNGCAREALLCGLSGDPELDADLGPPGSVLTCSGDRREQGLLGLLGGLLAAVDPGQ